ncbi:hypothetical protein RUND412_003418 [Rhizina undulata]
MPHATTPSPPHIRILDSTDKIYEDPASTEIPHILSTLNPSNCFLILEMLDGPTTGGEGQHYIQVYLNSDTSCLVEHREGAADKHFQADVLVPFEYGGCDIVARVFVSWALGEDDWREELEWQPLMLEEGAEGYLKGLENGDGGGSESD